MVHRKNRISYWIDWRLTGLAGPDYDATISFGLPFEPEDSQYGESRNSFVLHGRSAALGGKPDPLPQQSNSGRTEHA